MKNWTKMHGNYRHHYLLSATSSPPSIAALSGSAASKSSRQSHKIQQQQQQVLSNSDFNGLPVASQSKRSQILPSSYTQSQQFIANNRQFVDKQQQHLFNKHATLCSEQCCANLERRAIADSRHSFNMLHQEVTRSSLYEKDQVEGNDNNEDDDEESHSYNQDQYASQLRNSQIQQRFNQQHANSSNLRQQQQQHKLSQNHPSNNKANEHNKHSAVSSTSAPSHQQTVSSLPQTTSTAGQQRAKVLNSANQQEQRQLHVNFNRSNQAGALGANDDDGDEQGDSRKKKYLTAKYGQQQMNLIKKRLKIEMWLYEQLQELAKGSKSEAELDDIDIDLDQLLDLDDDDTRRRWLKKTLEPFEDVPGEKVEKFIEEVLEQSKLL